MPAVVTRRGSRQHQIYNKYTKSWLKWGGSVSTLSTAEVTRNGLSAQNASCDCLPSQQTVEQPLGQPGVCSLRPSSTAGFAVAVWLGKMRLRAPWQTFTFFQMPFQSALWVWGSECFRWPGLVRLSCSRDKMAPRERAFWTACLVEQGGSEQPLADSPSLSPVS